MKKIWLGVVAPIALLFLGGAAFADVGGNANGTPTVGGNGGISSITITNPLGSGCTDLTCPMQAIINFLFTIAIPLCAIMVLVGGFQMLTAAGDPAKFSNGRKTILYAVAGFAVILLAGGVATLIRNVLGGS